MMPKKNAVGGGNMITGNLLFNTGRAANKDEGSINTWDRAPYITTLRNGTASTIPAWNYINNNLCEETNFWLVLPSMIFSQPPRVLFAHAVPL